MKYPRMVEGIFIQRINRFIAEVIVDDKLERVHVKNTGRCKELFIEGQKIYLQLADNPNRKTKYSLISIYKGNMLVNVDSQVPNQVIFDAIKKGLLDEFQDIDVLKREYTYGHSRFDLYYKRRSGQEGFIEIKGVTLEKEGYATFPDAPTTRGTKHVKELNQAVKEGYESYVIFLIQLKPVKHFTPNTAMDPEFSSALHKAAISGVKILAFESQVTFDSIHLGKARPVIF